MSRWVAVFAGPSLPPSVRPADDRLTWLPPAATGDVMGLIGKGFDTICLIDGYFEHRPAPWHKELLEVMAAGIALFGASSMGALRAAELDRYGMVGVGAIYRAYRSGALNGDDEVALVHGPDSLGWSAVSVPLVEVRATLQKAVRERLVDAATARAMRSVAQQVHYADRDWPGLSQTFCRLGLADPPTVARLAAGHVQLKQADALLCLAAALDCPSWPSVELDVPQTCFLTGLRMDLGFQAKASSSKSTNGFPASPLKMK